MTLWDWLTGYRNVKVPAGDQWVVDPDPDAWWLADLTGLPGIPVTSYEHRIDPAEQRVSTGRPDRVITGTAAGWPAQRVDGRRPVAVTVVDPYGRSATEHLPLPATVRVRGWPNPHHAGDQHWVGVDGAAQLSYEAIGMDRPWWLGGRWSPERVCVYRLTDGSVVRAAPTPDAKSNAAGLPYGVMLVQPWECARGIAHAIGMSWDDGGDWFIPPARGTDGTLPDGIPYGSRLRLSERARDRRPRGGQAGAICDALERRGAIAYDKNHKGRAALTVVTSSDWDGDDLARLEQLTLADFDVVPLP